MNFTPIEKAVHEALAAATELHNREPSRELLQATTRVVAKAVDEYRVAHDLRGARDWGVAVTLHDSTVVIHALDAGGRLRSLAALDAEMRLRM